MYIDVVIKDMMFVSQTSYRFDNGYKLQSDTAYYTYYQTPSGLIPAIPNEDWGRRWVFYILNNN